MDQGEHFTIKVRTFCRIPAQRQVGGSGALDPTFSVWMGPLSCSTTGQRGRAQQVLVLRATLIEWERCWMQLVMRCCCASLVAEMRTIRRNRQQLMEPRRCSRLVLTRTPLPNLKIGSISTRTHSKFSFLFRSKSNSETRTLSGSLRSSKLNADHPGQRRRSGNSAAADVRTAPQHQQEVRAR